MRNFRLMDVDDITELQGILFRLEERAKAPKGSQEPEEWAQNE